MAASVKMPEEQLKPPLSKQSTQEHIQESPANGMEDSEPGDEPSLAEINRIYSLRPDLQWIMTRLSPRVWMSRIVIGVGVIGKLYGCREGSMSLYLLRSPWSRDGWTMAWHGSYLTLFYRHRAPAKRIGFYFTAAQVSAAVVGLVSAGFQKMDGERGIVGFRWMFLIYGICGTATGISLLWWLPERPLPPGESPSPRSKVSRWLPQTPPALTGRDAEVHYRDLKRIYHRTQWTLSDLGRVLMDWRIWPLLIMYFGVVGVGIGVQSYGTVIIRATNPKLTGVELSLLFAPIWITSSFHPLITPLSERVHHHCGASSSSSPANLPDSSGLLLTTYAGNPSTTPWPRYAGLLIVGFGLGPTVPITMTWTNEVFQPRHGEVGVAAASAVVSGLGNLGSIVSTYALYAGWESDRLASGASQYRKSNWVMIGMLVGSILAAVVMEVLLRVVDGKKGGAEVDGDGAARRESRQRGLEGVWFLKWRKK
ncbi:membrane transporter [Coccidioides immitis RMSCC 3703]|uniref:Membrane transporter n=1 Tax=Coccidioides immitis RMSCC 3703 TaxID=454286 RepID=A0A0J8TXL8_COCIT|nr:membrane transporter [Coccidioides immitis RMSCC 3703]